MHLHCWRTDASAACLLACSSVCLPSHSHACRLVFCRNASPMFVLVFVLSPPIILSLLMRFTSMCSCIALVSCVHVFSPSSYCLSVCLSACLPAGRRYSGYSQSSKSCREVLVWKQVSWNEFVNCLNSDCTEAFQLKHRVNGLFIVL